MKFCIPLLFLFFIGCQTTKKKQPDTMVPFESLGGHLVKISVKINGDTDASFLIDTGAGVNVISEDLCRKTQCKKSGSYTGKRMTGEEVTLQFSKIKKIEIGNRVQKDVRVGVIGLFAKLPESLGKIDGALSLKFFEEQPLTIDYTTSEVILSDQVKEGTSVPLSLKKDHEKLVAFVEMEKLGSFEVDTGNSLAVLNLTKLDLLGINVNSLTVTKVVGKNETGHPFVQFYTSIPQLKTKSGQITQMRPNVAFKEIIYDGVIGNDFFKGKKVTFDIPKQRMVFH